MKLGEKIKIQRRRLGWSRDALAVNAGVSEPTIYRLESDLAIPKMELLVKILSVLGGTIEVKFDAKYNKDYG
jgi:transcriptional regulator with XRE-family HTH domain